MVDSDCSGCQALQRRVAELERQLVELTRQRGEARRSGKRQAAPFRHGDPKAKPKRPGRKSGDAHGQHGHRPPPPPDEVQEVHDAPLPTVSPCCGAPLIAQKVVHQFQTEIPRRPIICQFNIHVGHCAHCGKRMQGRHPLQTSNALGAAASQLGPDAQAAMTILNKEGGLSHGKVTACLESLYGIDATRGASAQVMLRAADRLEPAYQEIKGATQQASS